MYGSKTSKYRGVSKKKGCNRSKPWQAQIRKDARSCSLGCYATQEEAARAYDIEAAKLGRELNLPQEWEDYTPKIKAKASKFRGLKKNKNGSSKKPWQAQIRKDGKSYSLGVYATEEEAARAHDAEAVKLGRELNFPEEWEASDFFLSIKSRSSKYRGVKANAVGSQQKPWQAQIRKNRKNCFLGAYATEEEAARIYDIEAAKLGRQMNFPSTSANNICNRKKKASKYRGVRRNTGGSNMRPWKASIWMGKRHQSLGVYATEEEAARVYDIAAAKLGKDLNFSEEHQHAEQANKKSSGVGGVRKRMIFDGCPTGSLQGDIEAASYFATPKVLDKESDEGVVTALRLLAECHRQSSEPKRVTRQDMDGDSVDVYTCLDEKMPPKKKKRRYHRTCSPIITSSGSDWDNLPSSSSSSSSSSLSSSSLSPPLLSSSSLLLSPSPSASSLLLSLASSSVAL